MQPILTPPLNSPTTVMNLCNQALIKGAMREPWLLPHRKLWKQDSLQVEPSTAEGTRAYYFELQSRLNTARNSNLRRWGCYFHQA